LHTAADIWEGGGMRWTKTRLEMIKAKNKSCQIHGRESGS
jgi:hypothetical protein